MCFPSFLPSKNPRVSCLIAYNVISLDYASNLNLKREYDVNGSYNFSELDTIILQENLSFIKTASSSQVSDSRTN